MSFHDKGATGSGAAPAPVPGPSLETISTAGLESPGDVGKAVYIDSAGHVALADATQLATGNVKGVWLGVANQIVTFGPAAACQFTTEGGQPDNGDPVFLAIEADDLGLSLGKLTAEPPTLAGAVVFKVGLCEDNSAYAADRVCDVHVQPQFMQVNPTP